MSGKRTSVYLTGDRLAAIEASGMTLLDIIDAGLMAAGAVGEDAVLGAAEDFGTVPAANCTHPKQRRQKGLCMACGRYIGKL